MHSKRKLSLIALLMALCLLLSSCALVKKDAAVDAATEIVKVAGQVFTKGEVQEQVDAYLAQLQQYYSSYYGYNIDITSSEIIASAQEDVINSLIEEAVISQKATEMGVSPLSEEAQAEVDAEWQEDYDLIKSIFFSGDDVASDTDLDSQIESYVAYYLGATKESLEHNKIEELLKAEVTKDVAVSEAEVQADFEAKVEDAKADYLDNLSAYGTAVLNGDTIYYRPAGYRMVKQILIRIADEDEERVDQLQALADEQSALITSAQATLTAAGLSDEEIESLLAQVEVTVGEMDLTAETLEALPVETTDTLAEDVADDVKEALRSLKAAQASYEKLTALVDEATEQQYTNIADRADEVLAKLADGADWDELVAEYNDDPGMMAGAANAETGYPVCENMSGMDAAFVQAAMALENIGDVSPKTRGMYGYYIVRYESDVAEGPVEMTDELRLSIVEPILTEKQDALYSETVTQWITDAKAVVDLKSLNN